MSESAAFFNLTCRKGYKIDWGIMLIDWFYDGAVLDHAVVWHIMLFQISGCRLTLWFLGLSTGPLVYAYLMKNLQETWSIRPPVYAYLMKYL